VNPVQAIAPPDAAGATRRYTGHSRREGPFMLAKRPMLAKAIVLVVFLGILGSLASAAVFLVKDKGQSDRTVKALTTRIGLSLGLFALLFILYALGLIEPHGIYH